MFAVIKAIAATILIAEVAGAFALGFLTLVMLALHVQGLIFWGLEAITACVVLYGCALFFRSALAYERTASRPAED